MSSRDYRRFNIPQKINTTLNLDSVMLNPYFKSMLAPFMHYSTDDISVIKQMGFQTTYKYAYFHETLNNFDKYFKTFIDLHSKDEGLGVDTERLSQFLQDHLVKKSGYMWIEYPKIVNLGYVLTVVSLKMSEINGGTPILWATEIRMRSEKLDWFIVLNEIISAYFTEKKVANLVAF